MILRGSETGNQKTFIKRLRKDLRKKILVTVCSVDDILIVAQKDINKWLLKVDISVSK